MKMSKQIRTENRAEWKRSGSVLSYKEYMKSITIIDPQSILDDMVLAAKEKYQEELDKAKQIKEAKYKHLYSCKRFMTSRNAKKSMQIKLKREKLNQMFDKATSKNDLKEADRLLILMKTLQTKEQKYADLARADYEKYFDKKVK